MSTTSGYRPQANGQQNQGQYPNQTPTASQAQMNQGQGQSPNQYRPPSNQAQMNQDRMNQDQMGGPQDRSEVQQAQQQLKQQGLYNGAVDGVVGPETQTALMKFQHEQGLPETAQFDQPTMDRLMGASPTSASPTSGTAAGGTQPMTGSNPYRGNGAQNPTSSANSR